MKKLKKSPGLNDNKSKYSGIEFLSYTIPPGKLKPNPNNPYKELPKDDYERLKKDIAERGIIDPLIIDENLILLTGHNRLKIAIELNLKEIPVRKISSEISEKEKEKILVLDNLNRRQLSPDEKRDFIKKYYGEEIQKDHRGKQSIKPTRVGFKEETNKINVAEKVSKEMGMSKRQAERIVSDIRKENKPISENPPGKKYTIEEAKKKFRKPEIKGILEEIEKNTKKMNDIKSKIKNSKDRLKSIGIEIE